VIRECENSEAIDELTIQCGVCLKKVHVESDRKNVGKLNYFKRSK